MENLKQKFNIFRKTKSWFIMRTLFMTNVFLMIFLGSIGLPTYNTEKVILERDGHKIVLLGMIHAAPNDFYVEVKENIKKYKNEGYKYYYEQVEVTSREDYEEFKRINGDFTSITNNIKKSLNFDSQAAHQEISSGGENADITMKEIVKQLKENNTSLLTDKEKKKLNTMNKVVKETQYFEKVKESEFQQWFLKAVMRFSFRSAEFWGVKGNFNDIIIEQRNDILLNTIDYKHNAMVTYGQLHLEDIIEKLERRGYKVITTDKIKVF